MPENVVIESFTVTIDDLTSTSANLGMMWSNVYVAVNIEVPSDASVEADIKKTLEGPSAGDYYTAATYYSREGKDIKQAKEWIKLS